MKPINYKKRNRAIWKFLWVFGLLFLVIFGCGICTLQTGNLGVLALEKKHATYTSIFEKQVSYVYQIEDIIKRLNHLSEEDRTLSQHKQYQMIISNLRDELQNELEKEAPENMEYFEIYQSLERQVSAIQDVLDKDVAEKEIYQSQVELLDRCKEKYAENLQKLKDNTYDDDTPQ